MNYLKYLLFFFILFLFPFYSNAATLGFSPSSGTYKAGETFSVSVVVNTENKSINAVSANIIFPTSLLRVVSVSKSDSVINYWVQEPSFSNTNGTINLEGVIVNPGFTGSSGKVLRITFEAKSSGVSDVKYEISSVLANDGLGTNVLSVANKASFTIGATSAISTTPGADSTPAPIFVSSSTHPDPNEWYAKKDLKLEWSIPPIVDAISYELDQTVSTNPGTNADKKVSFFERKDLQDGTWFFHLRARNSGGWGSVSHFRVQVDTDSPEYLNILSEGEKEGRAVFSISAKDETSGIKSYEIRIDAGEPTYLPGSDIATFTAPILVTGKHTIFVKAYDFAGNHTANSIDFESTGLVPPKLVEYPVELKYKENLRIAGISSPNHDVILTLVRQSQKRGITEEIYYFSNSAKIELPVEKKLVRAGIDGIFRYTWEKKLLAGTYRIYAVAVDKEGNESAPSEQISFEVLESKFVRVLTYLTSLLSVVVPFIGIILFTIIMLLYARKKYKNLQYSISTELDKTEKEVGEALRRHDETTQMLENVRHNGGKSKEETLVLREHEQDIELVEKTIKQKILNLRKRLMGK